MDSRHRRRNFGQRRRQLIVASVSAVIAVLVAGGVAYAVKTQNTDVVAPKPTPTAPSSDTPVPTPTPTPTPTQVSKAVDKVIVILIENKSSSQIRSEAPRLTALSDTFGKAPAALAPCDHPSQPNYVCLSAGRRLVTSNEVKTVSGPDIWNNTLNAGRTMKMYVDNLPASLGDRRKSSGKYAARHVFTVPFVATAEKQANFARYTVNSTTLAGDVAKGALPNVGALVPDLCHDAHDRCKQDGPSQIAQADNWIADQIEVLQSGSDWKSGHLLIVVTADEDDKKGANDIPMIVIHPSLSHFSTDVPVTLYSVGGLLADVGHTPRLGNQATAPDFAKAFDLEVATQ